MRARLYSMEISHPANAARLMLERKGIEHEIVDVSPGMQAWRCRIAGFAGGTVPALRIDGRRVAGTRAISRLLDELQPDPPLFPADPERRRAVQDAEAWGEEIFQPVPRRLLRWAVRNDADTRVTFSRMLGYPLPAISGRLMGPATAFYARREDARSTDRIRADWKQTPALLDRVDELIAEGVIGGADPNAADFQIATTVRVMLAFEDYEPLIAGRPAEALALRLWPEYPHAVPALLPADMRVGSRL